MAKGSLSDERWKLYWPMGIISIEIGLFLFFIFKYISIIMKTSQDVLWPYSPHLHSLTGPRPMLTLDTSSQICVPPPLFLKIIHWVQFLLFLYFWVWGHDLIVLEPPESTSLKKTDSLSPQKPLPIQRSSVRGIEFWTPPPPCQNVNSLGLEFKSYADEHKPLWVHKQ